MTDLIRDPDVLARIEQRVRWLAVRMVDYANRERPADGGSKVGGHQASSASMTTMLTALYLGFLRADDRVAIKPHASPVLHALSYLLGSFDARYLTELRAYGGLQAYPSSSKDPYPIDFSTGSVGLGAVAPLFAAATSRYVADHFEVAPAGRFIATLGDAELDEGNVWEAVAEAATAGLRDVIWIVDVNRQSLDRVVPGIKAGRFEHMFAENGWTVIEAKYGPRLRALFAEPHGNALRDHLDGMSNEDYQDLFAITDPAVLRKEFLKGADPMVAGVLAAVPDDDLLRVLTDLGGHDFGDLLDCLDRAEASAQPSVIFAYTIKGWGLPMAGHPLNHSALLNETQIDELRHLVARTPENEWERFEVGTPEAKACTQTRARLERPRLEQPALPEVPFEVGLSTAGRPSTQAAFGRSLVALNREAVGNRIVTTAPDVTVSTNLAGWVNAAGVYSSTAAVRPAADDRTIRWNESPQGRHIELGISEMNLFLLLGQLGLAGPALGQPIVPIGTVYDPFVLRGLDAFVYSQYCDASFIVVGTPSGVTLSHEGGAHQSIITPSVGMELPGVTFLEPAFVKSFDWLFCDAIRATLDPSTPGSFYFRLSTRPEDQRPFGAACERLGVEALRTDVLAGGYLLIDGQADAEPCAPVVNLVASGAVLPEVVDAAALLSDEGVAANVIDITSPDRLFAEWRQTLRSSISEGTVPRRDTQLAALFPESRRSAPIVTVHDASPHSLAWIGSAFGAMVVPLGTETFGQSGSLPDIYRHHQLDSESILAAALIALER